MKILSKRKQNEALMRLAAMVITAKDCLPAEYLTSFHENGAELAYLIGGVRGMNKVKDEAFGVVGDIVRAELKHEVPTEMSAPNLMEEGNEDGCV